MILLCIAGSRIIAQLRLLSWRSSRYPRNVANAVRLISTLNRSNSSIPSSDRTGGARFSHESVSPHAREQVRTVREELRALPCGAPLRYSLVFMLSQASLSKFVAAIHSCPGLTNCTIGYVGNGQCRVLFKPNKSISGYEDRVAIVLEEQKISDATLIAELQRMSAGNGEMPPRTPNPQVATNRSKIGPELIGAGLACGLTIVSAFGVAAGVAGEIPTGGASTFLVLAGWTGFGTASIQCANGLVRVGSLIATPQGNTLAQWDNTGWYSTSILVVDAIGIAGGITSLPLQVRNLFAVLSRQRSFIARGLSLEALRNMNRAGRINAISEVFADAGRTAEGREALVKAAREMGVGPRTLQSTTGLSVQASAKMVKSISIETSRRLMASVRDILATTAGTTGSAMPSSLVGSASGSVNYTINVIEVGG